MDLGETLIPSKAEQTGEGDRGRNSSSWASLEYRWEKCVRMVNLEGKDPFWIRIKVQNIWKTRFTVNMFFRPSSGKLGGGGQEGGGGDESLSVNYRQKNVSYIGGKDADRFHSLNENIAVSDTYCTYFAFMLVAESIASLNVQCFFLIASAFMSLPTVASWIRRSGPPPPPPNRPSSVRSWKRNGHGTF